MSNKLSEVNENLSNELASFRLTQLETNFKEFSINTTKSLSEIHDNVLKLSENLKTGSFMTSNCKNHTEKMEKIEKTIDTHDKRLTNIEKWKWKIVGGLAVAAVTIKLIFPVILHIFGVS